VPELYEIDDVLAIFQAEGFEAAAARLAFRFVPAAGHGHHDHGHLIEWINYYYDQKLLLRFRRNASGGLEHAVRREPQDGEPTAHVPLRRTMT
jgi:hypothetical protein